MRRLLSSVTVLLLLAALVALAAAPAPAATPGKPAPARNKLREAKLGKLVKADRVELSRKASKRQGARVILLSKVGGGDELAQLVRSRGGRITSVDDKAGWVVAEIQAKAALALESSKLVRIIALDRPVSLPRPGKADRAAAARLRDRPNLPPPGTGNVNPYLPAGDIHAPQFIEDHPTWDGRGVKLFVLDTGIDWGAPGLQETSYGSRKVVKWFDATSEGTIRTNTVVTVAGGTFTVAGVTYTLPSGLTYDKVRFGRLRESSFAPQSPDNDFGQDINRDGDGDDVFPVAVVSSPQLGLTIHVDTDLDASFADEKALADWNHTYKDATIGTDDPATTSIQELVRFGANACTDAADNPCFATLADLGGATPATAGDFWNVIFDGGQHGTNVSSIAAGNDLEIGEAKYDGVAPGATLYAMRVLRSNGSSIASSVGDGMIRAAELGADVINMSLGGLPAINVGAPLDPQATLLDNLSQAFGVAFSLSAGNSGAGSNTIGSPGTAAAAVTAGAYVSPATWDVNYNRFRVPHEGIFYFSSIGPNEDGAYKPNVVAPGSALAAVPNWYENAFDIHPLNTLPPGFAVFQGTSMSAPQVAGAMAILASAAEQTHRAWTPHSLKRSLELGARRVDGGPQAYQEVEVGHGLVQVDKAWRWLTRLGTVDRDVQTQTFNFQLGVGEGVYAREYFHSHESVLLYTFSEGTHTYELSSNRPWMTPTPEQVTVPGSPGTDAAGNPVAGFGAFTANFRSRLSQVPGLFSGVIRADDPTTRDPADFEMLNTIVTPHQFDAANQYSLHFRGTGRQGIEAEKYKRFFVKVPAGAGALQLSAFTPTPAATLAGIDMYVTNPLGVPVSVLTEARAPGTKANLTISNPDAGVWEIDLHARERSRPADLPVSPFHGYDLTAKLLTVNLTPSSWTISPATPGAAYTQAFTAENVGATFTGRATGTPLSQALRERHDITAAAAPPACPPAVTGLLGTPNARCYTVPVPAGTTELTAHIGNPSDGSTDLDLFVIDPTGNLADFDADGDADETVTIANPATGDWTVVVDPFAVTGTVGYDYAVDLAVPGLTTIATDDTEAARPAGSSWSFTASVQAPATPPPAGWSHSGAVVVVDAGANQVSEAPVLLQY